MVEKEILKTWIEEYKKALPERLKNQKYKWQAVEHFRKNWNPGAENFGQMFLKATEFGGKSKLLHTTDTLPVTKIAQFSENDDETMRQMFRELYEESEDLELRIGRFSDFSDKLLEKYNVPEKGIRLHRLRLNATSTFLWLRYPDKYYIYNYETVCAVSDKLGADFFPKLGNYPKDIVGSYKMYDEICAELQKDDELRKILSGSLDNSCWPDKELRTTTQDFGAFVQKHTMVSSQNYWWLNAKPEIWSFSKIAVGESESFELYDENGKKHRVNENFLAARVGDPVICYESSPISQIVALGEISAEAGAEQKEIQVQKTEELKNPVLYSELKALSEAEKIKLFATQTGTLFKLTKHEYDHFKAKIREKNDPPASPEEYSETKFLDEVYISADQYKELRAILEYKKNVILQGPPGVGKTFAAKRLAYSIMGEKDDSRIEFVQFHQNYSYEDFVMGFKPTDDEKNSSGFKLEKGVFFKFCERARAEKDPGKKYFFIIDEINRGNMSKIFGELLMLIENDKRGDDYRVTLPYTGKSFSIPDNLYIIGMMNTADRSLAMIDYALRRRFAFFTMVPAFGNEKFETYRDSLGNEKFKELMKRIVKLNDEIKDDKSLGEGFCIGHSYFCGLDKMKDQNELEKRLDAIVNFEIKPMINEYCFDDSEKSKKWIAILEGKTEGKSDGKSNGESDDKR